MYKLFNADGSYRKTDSAVDAFKFLTDSPMKKTIEVNDIARELLTSNGLRVLPTSVQAYNDLCAYLVERSLELDDQEIPLDVRILRFIEIVEGISTDAILRVFQKYGSTEEEIMGTLNKIQDEGLARNTDEE